MRLFDFADVTTTDQLDIARRIGADEQEPSGARRWHHQESRGEVAAALLGTRSVWHFRHGPVSREE